MNVFIISWFGQHEKAALIAEKILLVCKKVSILYSDPDPDFVFVTSCKLIKRPNELFWEDKFKSCLDNAGNEGILVIHADCICEDWGGLVKRCFDINSNNNEIGVWSPHTTGSPYELNVSGILKINDSELILSARTDGIIFYLSPAIVNRMQQSTYGENKYGWGIAALFCAAAHVLNKLIIIDTSVKVLHPQGKRGYNENEAKLTRAKFLSQFSLQERIAYELLQSHVYYKRAKIMLHKRTNDQRSNSGLA